MWSNKVVIERTWARAIQSVGARMHMVAPVFVELRVGSVEGERVAWALVGNGLLTNKGFDQREQVVALYDVLLQAMIARNGPGQIA